MWSDSQLFAERGHKVSFNSFFCHQQLHKIMQALTSWTYRLFNRAIVAIVLLSSAPHLQAQKVPIVWDSVRHSVDVTMDTTGLNGNVYPNGPMDQSRLWARKVWSIAFRVPAILLPPCSPDSVLVLGWQDIDSAYPSLVNLFKQLDSQYGGCKLIKALPADTTPILGQMFNIELHDSAQVTFVDSVLNIDTNMRGSMRLSIPEGSAVPADLGMVAGAPQDILETGQTYNFNSAGHLPYYHLQGWHWGLWKTNFPLAWDVTKGSPSVVIAERGEWFKYSREGHHAPEYVVHANDDISPKQTPTDSKNFAVLTGVKRTEAGYNNGDGLSRATPDLWFGHEAQCMATSIARADNVSSQNDHNLVGGCPDCNGVGLEMANIKGDDRVPAENKLEDISHLDVDLGSVTNQLWKSVSVVNISSTGEQNAIGYSVGLLEQGIIVVASAGNGITNPLQQFPASHAWVPFKSDLTKDYRVIAVGGTKDGSLTDCTGPFGPVTFMRGAERSITSYNYSPGYYKFGRASNATAKDREIDVGAAFMDIVAPGSTVSIHDGNAGNDAPIAHDYTGNVVEQWGTSYAAPLVSATCGLMLSVRPYMGVQHTIDDDGRPLFIPPYDGVDVQRRAYDILTITADKLDDDNVTESGTNGSNLVAYRYVLQGSAGLDQSYADHMYSGGQDRLNRSWGQRMGFGRLNAFRAVAHAIETKANFSYDANSLDLDFNSINQSISPAGKRLIHLGAWYDATHTLLPILSGIPAVGGKALPGTSATHNNHGETRINSTSSSSTGTILHVPSNCIAAIDGILTTDHAKSTESAVNKIMTSDDGLILETGYISNVEVVGNIHAADLIVDGSTGKVSGLVVSTGCSAEFHNKIVQTGTGKVSVAGGAAIMESGCNLNLIGSQGFAVTGSGTVTMKTVSSIIGGWYHYVTLSSVSPAPTSKLIIDTNAIVTIDAIVTVENGGELIIRDGARLSLKGFIVAVGGKLSLGAGATLSLMEPSFQNTCDGVMTSNEGNSSVRPKITGKLFNCCYSPCDSVVDYAVLISGGDPANTANNHIRLTNTDLIALYLRGRFDINGLVTIPNRSVTNSNNVTTPLGVRLLASTTNPSSVYLHPGALAGSKLVNEGLLEVQAGAVVKLGVEILNNHDFKSLATSAQHTSLQCETLPFDVSIRSGVNSTNTGKLSTVNVEYTTATNVRFEAIQKTTGHFSHNSFVMQSYNPSCCIALYGLSISSIDITSNTFSTFSTFEGTYGQSTNMDTAIAAIDILIPAPGEKIKYNIGASGAAGIKGFEYGVALNAGAALVDSNKFAECTWGVYTKGISKLTRIRNNTITGWGTRSEGIHCESASNPYIVHNTISNGKFGVVSDKSTPFLGCNTITAESDVGVNGGARSTVGMGLDKVFSGIAAQNHVKANSNGQVRFSGWSVDMINGGNEIDGFNATTGTLLCGTPAPNGIIIDVQGNWWGNRGGNTPWLGCAGLFNDPPPPNFVNFLPLSGQPSSDCDANTIGTFSVPNCYLHETYFNSMSGHFNDVCDSLMALYMKDINCGNCVAAVLDLQKGIDSCDPNSLDEISDLLQRVLWHFNDCNEYRNAAGIVGLVSWYNEYAQNTSHDSNRIVAAWMKGMALGSGQYFSTAIALYDSIASLHLGAPYDSVAAAGMSDMYRDMMNVEGDTPFDGMGKAISHSMGRFGDVPSEANLVDLQVAPNPLHQNTTVYYTVPLDDAEDFVDLKVYNLRVEDVSNLVHEVQTAGKHSVQFNASALPSGRYIVACHLRNHQQSKLIFLIR